MKVAYNRCYGGFSLSHAGIMRWAELKGIKLYPFIGKYDEQSKCTYHPATEEELKSNPIMMHYCTSPEWDEKNSYFSPYEKIYEDRSDSILIQVIEEMGEAANGSCAELAIEDVPAGTLWRIDEYDGNERIMTQESYDWKVAT